VDAADMPAEEYQLVPVGDKPLTRVRDVVHSFVQTVQIQIKTPSSHVSEELLVPPRLVSSCTATVLGRAMISNLERYAMGSCLPAWLQSVAQVFHAIFFLLAADTAASNKRVMNNFEVLLARLLLTAVTTFIFTFVEYCNMHLLCRVTTFMLNDTEICAPMYAMSRIVNMRSHKGHLRHAAKIAAATLDFKPNTQPPERDATIEQLLFEIIDIKTISEAGANPDEDDEATVRNSRRLDAMRELYGFIHCDPNSGDWTHCCQGCCRGKPHAIKRHQPSFNDFILCVACGWLCLPF
jgi:hypothetical protein